MPWVKFDDQCPEHPKLIGIPDAALAAWFRGICWSSRTLTDGYLPACGLATITGSTRWRKAAADLVERGLWIECEGGFEIHDYARYQPTREKVMRDREEWRKRQAKARGHDDVTP